MQVETFECVETASEPIEACEEALELIATLGLEGQKELTVKRENSRDSRMPYRQITAEELFVYGVLCPEKVPLKDYKSTPIPLRVLQIAAHASSLGTFKKLEVWDRVSVTVKDPVLVAYMTNPKWTWQEDVFILARWGETLETFSVLLKRALTVKREQVIERLECVTSKAKMLLDNIESLTTAELIKNGPTWTPTFEESR